MNKISISDKGINMTTIRLSIEGQNACDAAADFFELPDISGTWEPVNETRRDPTLEIVNAVAIFSTITGHLQGLCVSKDFGNRQAIPA